MDLTDAELNEIISYDKMCQQMTQAVDRLQSDYVEQLSLRTSQGKPTLAIIIGGSCMQACTYIHACTFARMCL